jgi:urease accessory protein UreE|tara:strand:- start:228 stop:458 length:231 start_codon:yes stop_codon:yes gene_type:complete
MKFGYVLCDPKRLKILGWKGKTDVQMLTLDDRENLEKAICLKDISSMKSLYIKLKSGKRVKNLDIVNIQELYKSEG